MPQDALIALLPLAFVAGMLLGRWHERRRVARQRAREAMRRLRDGKFISHDEMRRRIEARTGLSLDAANDNDGGPDAA